MGRRTASGLDPSTPPASFATLFHAAVRAPRNSRVDCRPDKRAGRWERTGLLDHATGFTPFSSSLRSSLSRPSSASHGGRKTIGMRSRATQLNRGMLEVNHHDSGTPSTPVWPEIDRMTCTNMRSIQTLQFLASRTAVGSRGTPDRRGSRSIGSWRGGSRLVHGPADPVRSGPDRPLIINPNRFHGTVRGIVPRRRPIPADNRFGSPPRVWRHWKCGRGGPHRGRYIGPFSRPADAPGPPTTKCWRWRSRKSPPGPSGAAEGVPWASVEEILRDDRVRMVCIETDPLEALRYSHRVIVANKHLKIDKPPGADLTALERLFQEAGRRNLLIQMGYVYRYNPAFRLALRAIRRVGWGGFDPPSVR